MLQQLISQHAGDLPCFKGQRSLTLESSSVLETRLVVVVVYAKKHVFLI